MVTEPIGHDLAGRFGTGGKHAPEKPLHRSLVATLLQEDIKLCAVLIDCPPQQIRLAAQCHEHLVKVPGAARLLPHRVGALGESCAELVAPAADRFVRDHDATLKQQLLDVAQAQAEPEIPANRAADDDGSETVTVMLDSNGAGLPRPRF